MLSISGSTRIFICRDPVDFRKAHDGLVAIVRDHLGEDIFAGGIFVFLNKRRDRVKLLEWDKNGLWLHYKRLERGTFKWAPPGASNKALVSRAELSMLLEGIDLKAGRIRRHFADELCIHGRCEEEKREGSAARCGRPDRFASTPR